MTTETTERDLISEVEELLAKATPPDETWGRKELGDEHPKIPAAVFDLFRMMSTSIEMTFTPLEFVRFRHDVESFGVTLREISRVPYHDEETII